MMFANGFGRIYFYHLKKCGGTSLSEWLSLAGTDAAWTPDWVDPFDQVLLAEAEPDPSLNAQRFAARAASVFHWTDAVSSHAPLRPFAPRDAFCATVLRRPVDRILSQVADWRRLRIEDHAGVQPRFAAAMRDAQRLGLRRFLEEHATATFPFLFDNHLTRALAAARLGWGITEPHDPASLSSLAELALHVDFDLVGLAEDLDATRDGIASRLGLPSPAPFPALNVTGSGETMANEREDAADLLAHLTRFDEPLYALACSRFEAQRSERERYRNNAEFETRHVANAVRDLRGRHWRGHTVYSVREPLIGSGFFPRDAPGRDNCRVWTGPGETATLYMPAPVGVPLRAKMWVHGYADESQRGSVRVEINDRPVTHSFEPVDGWREAISAPAQVSAPWLKMTITVDRTHESPPNAERGGDARRRGVSFDRYGWEIVA